MLHITLCTLLETQLVQLSNDYLPLTTLASDVVLNGSADLAFIQKCTVNHPVKETSLKLHL
jgi:hypothetical protein